MQNHYTVRSYYVCFECGQARGLDLYADMERDCPECREATGTAIDEVSLVDALRDLGIFDRLAALESEVRHLGGSNGR